MIKRLSILVAALCLATSTAVLAQGKTTRIVVSFPPGGPVDFVARALGEQLGKELGQTVIVENKAGANGAIGASEVMRAAADGSTLWISSVGDLIGQLFSQRAGIKLLHVPYKGAAPAITDLMGGQVSGFFGDIPGLVGHVRAGKLKAIGLASPTRHPALPDVKTLAEQGFPGVDTNNWYALFAPAKTPPATINEINAAVRRALAAPALRERLMSTGTEPAPSTPQELAALLKRDTDKWAKLIRDKQIKAQ